jgi:hypothetical protein
MTLFRAIAAVIAQLAKSPHACLTTQTIRNSECYNTKVQKQWTRNRNTVQKWKKWLQFRPNFEMSQHLQRKYVKRYKIRVLEQWRQNVRQNEGPLNCAERARHWRWRCKAAARGVNVGASTSTREPAVPVDLNDMDSMDDVVSSSQESGFTKVTMVTDDTRREPSAGAGVSAASEAAVTTEPQYERAVESYRRPLLATSKNKWNSSKEMGFIANHCFITTHKRRCHKATLTCST